MRVFSSLFGFCKRRPYRATLMGILVLLFALSLFRGPQLTPELEALSMSPTDVSYSQSVTDIVAGTQDLARLKSLTVVEPESRTPKYVLQFKDSETVSVVTVPRTTHLNLESEVLLKQGVPYTIAPEVYVVANSKWLNARNPKPDVLESIGGFLARNFVGILLIGLMIYTLRNQMNPFGGNKVKVTAPDAIQGNLDDLIGMDDIKREVAHLEDMLRNRDTYQAHNILKPFNIMMTGPAGTGKTKLAGYLAKRLGFPILFTSGSNLESGLIGGGSRTLTNLYKDASKHENCIIFLDEAQSLFAKRGQSKEKWSDDTANTLLALLDGVKTEAGKNVIWIVASNFDESTMAMDEAMLRRFAVKINFRLPNKAERKELLRTFLAKKDAQCVDWDNLNLDYVAEITANLSPALLETVADRASMLAIQEKTRIDTDLLFRAFERATIGLTDRAATAEKNKQRERIAIHELGHFFMQLDPHLKAGLSLADVKEQARLLKISTEAVSKIGALGYVLSRTEDSPLHTLNELEQEVIELYGGVAAEELFYGKRGISVGSRNDIQKATRLLSLMVNELSMYSGAKLDYSLIGEGRAEETSVKAMETKAEALYAQTLAAMEGYREHIDALKSVLLERYVLSKDEVFALLAERKLGAATE